MTDPKYQKNMAERPSLAKYCTRCGERCGLRRHVKELAGKYYAVCYDCSEGQ